MADTHMNQNQVNRSTLEAPVNGTLDWKNVLSCRFSNLRHPEKQDSKCLMLSNQQFMTTRKTKSKMSYLAKSPI